MYRKSPAWQKCRAFGRSSRYTRGGAVLLLCLFLGSACGPETDYRTFEGATMGTYYRVTSLCPGRTGDQVEAAIIAELDTVNQQMSTYLSGSELSRFNDSPVGHWHPVSADLLGVVMTAAEITSLSEGAFDVTVGPLINLWGFGPDGAIDLAPAADAIDEARARVGARYLQADTSTSSLRKSGPVSVDLSAIAKGHGVDRIANVLQEQGCQSYLVDVGGEVLGRGRSATDRAWRVGIEVPDPELIGGVQRVLALADVAVATSGDYRNYLDLDGRRVSHTLDPRTGYPVSHGLASVSVVHGSAMWADGLATALNVMGPEAGYALAAQEGLAALFLIRRATGFEERYTPAMRNYLEEQQ